jgi:hypothetical protein
MRKTQPCIVCGKLSLPGFAKGTGKCQYHWNIQAFGKEWADEVVKRESEKGRGENNAK